MDKIAGIALTFFVAVGMFWAAMQEDSRPRAKRKPFGKKNNGDRT